MNRIDIILLGIIDAKEAVSNLSAITIKEMWDEDLGIKENTYQHKLRKLKENGYVAHGMKDARANTYYITPKGKELLSHIEE